MQSRSCRPAGSSQAPCSSPQLAGSAVRPLDSTRACPFCTEGTSAGACERTCCLCNLCNLTLAMASTLAKLKGNERPLSIPIICCSGGLSDSQGCTVRTPDPSQCVSFGTLDATPRQEHSCWARKHAAAAKGPCLLLWHLRARERKSEPKQAFVAGQARDCHSPVEGITKQCVWHTGTRIM